MNFWIWLWKIVFILGVGLFSLMAVWVTIGGWQDVKHLLRDLKTQHEKDSSSDSQSK